MSSLYLHGVSAAPPSSGYGDPYPLFLTPQPPPPRSYSSELVSLYGNDLSSSWNTEPHPLEPPLLSTVKRPAEEALFDGDIMSKQARVDSVSNLHAYPQRSGEKYCAFYMRTRTCSFGANCKYDHPTWVPIGGIPDWNEASAPKSNSGLPVHPGEPDCVFFSKTGLSKYGSKCLFNHPIDTSIKLSGKKSPENVTHETAVATISSMAANDTVYARVSALGVSRDEGGGNAPPKAATAFNAKGFPLRPGGSDCAFYMKKGSCKFGAACRFNHPEQKEASVALQSQASGAAMLGGLLGGLVTPFLYARTLANSGLSIPASALGGINLAQTAYPQRPGEATCSYYLKTGTCKFGGCCKFHHPINRTDPAAEPSVKLTLAGLPRHEGKSSCPFYMKTGTCKFGTNCKFDHPPPGEAAAKALAEAGKSEEKQSNDGNPNTKEEN